MNGMDGDEPMSLTGMEGTWNKSNRVRNLERDGLRGLEDLVIMLKLTLFLE